MSATKKTKRALGEKKNEETETQILKLQIARLEEQVKLLTMENDRLRNHGDSEESIASKTSTSTVELESSNLNETPRSVRYMQRNTNIQPIKSRNISITMKMCGCRGNCATKVCGCMKRDISCSILCKCNKSVCQNQEKNDEEQNKENLKNIEVVHVEDKQKIRNKNLAKVAPQRSLFSPDTVMSRKLSESCTRNLSQCLPIPPPVNAAPGSRAAMFDVGSGISDNFNPMKPKYQLRRTPTNDKRSVDSHTGSSSPILSPDIMNKEQEELKVPEEFNQAEVDWDKYQAQRIPCKKCKRKFHKSRIEKHQDCCKKVGAAIVAQWLETHFLW